MKDLKSKTSESTTGMTEVGKASVSSRRRFLAKAAVPAVLTVISKPVFATGSSTGRRCTISGFTSVSPSGVARHRTDHCAGFSHGAWKTPYGGSRDSSTNNSDGSLFQWIQAGKNCGLVNGFIPLPPDHDDVNGVSGGQDGRAEWKALYDDYFKNPDDTYEAPTNFRDIFNDGPTETLHEVLLNNSGSLNFDAAAALMSACLFQWNQDPEKIHPLDIIGLFNASPNTSYTTTSGNVIKRPSDSKLQRFFQQLQH